MELFAWLTEMNVYRLDRTVDAAYRAFLRRVGVEMLPVQIADTQLIVNVVPPGNLVSLPPGIQISGADDIIFQTTNDINISPAQIVTVLANHDAIWTDVTIQNADAGTIFQAFPSAPAKDAALYVGFDQSLANQAVQISMYVWTNTVSADRVTRQRLIAEEQLRPASCECDPPPWSQHYGVQTVWEYRTNNDKWLPLSDVIDETRALSLSGPVKFTAPLDHAPGGVSGYLDPYFIRCRVVCGKYDCPTELDVIALNVVAASNAADIEAEESIGVSTGRALQVFQTKQISVAPASTKIRVLVNNQEVGSWSEILFWDLVGPQDYSYLLSPDTGEITFGDGRIGRVPPAAAEIRATYQVGGGAAGNVAAGSLINPIDNAHNAALVVNWQTIRASLNVTQPFAAEGGVPAETLIDAEARAIDDFALQKRAVSLSDFEALALAIPGAQIARVRALANYDPAMPCYPAQGCVTVVVIPCCPDPRPEPTPDLLRAVHRYLDRRRTLTTELRLVGPSYSVVTVSARLHPAQDAEGSKLQALAVSALGNFFHPLHGGPDGNGWPVGRGVYRTEVMALLAALPGVMFVDKLCLKLDCSAETCCDNLIICPENLVASGTHNIEIAGRSCCNESA
jgi:hypothetical protein